MDHTGVKARGKSIEITWFNQGKRFRETVRLPATKKNLAYAAQLRAEILRKITLGTFRYADYFPESPNAERMDSPTFYQMAKAWIEGQNHLAFSTEKEYRAMLNRYWLPSLADLEIRNIKHTTLLEVIAMQTWSAKTRNNAMGPLKAIFDLAHIDGIIESNPAARIRNAKVQKPEPDPLTLEEANLVLDWMKREPMWQNYFGVAFFTGMRTSELIALKWSDIDSLNNTIRVSRAKVRTKEKGTKTNTVRDIELSSVAMQYLAAQKKHTFLANEEVFIHPNTKQPIIDDRPPRLFWESALKALGMRHRAAYQTRHTCITLWLMAGANPMWVARQAGHSSPQMTFNRYARWIDRADAGQEMAKFEAKISAPRTGTDLK